jgi:hypothetical protein
MSNMKKMRGLRSVGKIIVPLFICGPVFAQDVTVINVPGSRPSPSPIQVIEVPGQRPDRDPIRYTSVSIKGDYDRWLLNEDGGQDGGV